MKYCKLIVTTLLAGTSAVFYWMFLLAYFNKSKSVKIYINHYGEANIELVLMSILMFAALVLIIAMTWRLIANELNRYKRPKIYWLMKY